MRTLLLVLVTVACGPIEEDEPDPISIAGHCSVFVEGVGELDMEQDYLPHVVACENDGAGPEALRAQAVAARSYAYYKIEESGSVVDGQGDQVYTCSRPPRQEHFDAVAATRREVLVYHELVIAAFYVAGADPSDRATCVAVASDPDPTNTEKYVTYNESSFGLGVQQTSLGWIHPENWENRGCMSQWGGRCLDGRGDGYRDILRFYYGEDIEWAVADVDCGAQALTATGAGSPFGAQTPWRPEMRLGAH